MSDILIKGMEMPTKENAVILITPSGDVWMIGDMPNEDTHLVKAKAVPVPPYGRLIDIEPFMRGLYEEIQMGQITYTSQELYDMMDEEIKSMPTIIETEGGKT